MNGSSRVFKQGTPADQSIQLESGKQLAVSGGLPVLRPASDTSEILSLKCGQINMKDAGIQDVLSTVAQWYDVRVEYLGAIPDKKFSLKVPLESNLSVIIDMIKKQGVHITMQGKVITVVK
jgi:transmembrane sensor